jgi:UDP-N-acetylmuramate dehydrogenase
MTEIYKILKKFGQVKLNEPLSKHTTFKIGGPAELFLIVESTENLLEALKYLDAEGIEHFILGGGSNMLVRDEGYHGVVVKVKSNKFVVTSEGIVADAGCSTVAIANLSMKESFVGFEWGVGIPGTIGGAVRGNAGAMGGDMSGSVEKVEVYQDGEAVEYSLADCDFHYRHSIFKDNSAIILRVHLKLQKSEDKEGMKKALANLQYRSKTQPQGYASTGCIFKNFEIPKDFIVPDAAASIPEEFLQKGKISAGWLIDQAGMKGAQIGEAQVSPTHGNFIVNLGNAKGNDVLTLIDEIKEKVYNIFNIKLEEEIQIV